MIPTLSPAESRVLGVLIEKATTTPDQYPLSINAITNGANQKNNRDPVLTMTEDECFDAVESLRAKGLAIRVDVPGSRVSKYRHAAGDVLRARTGELAILAELLLRGPQTQGELRTRASRMSAMESLDVVRGLLNALMERPEPLVKELPRAAGSRAETYVQLLCADLHPVATTSAASVAPAEDGSAGVGLSERVSRLEDEVATLKAAIQKLQESAGLLPSPGTPGDG